MNGEDHLRSIFRAALDAVDPYALVAAHLRGHPLPLDNVGRILVLGVGKAAAPMARAAEDVLGDSIAGGLVVTKHGHGEPLTRLRVAEAGHPTPDHAGEVAARELAHLAAGADARTLVLMLVSGGGSALLPAPADGISLADKQAVTTALLAAGADIAELNCVRKHLSALKGGRLLRLLAPARTVALILSDVVGDRLDTIASGLTAPDPTSYADALAVLDRHHLRGTAPATILRLLQRGAAGDAAETVKPGDPVLALADNRIVGGNSTALDAAAKAARARGYQVRRVPQPVVGEAREAARALFSQARGLAGPVCLLAGGETVVRVTGRGRGGRNQELALAFLAEMRGDPRRGDGMAFLSAATDGGDGPTDAAGAFASPRLLAAAEAAGLSIDGALADNDSHAFFDAVGGLLRTGPTRTNVCDLQIALVT